MTSRICKFGCGTMLEGFDEINRKYIEAGSGGLHTKERCEEAKAKLRTVQGEKNNHGNELVQPLRPTEELAKPPYVDHTQGAKLKLKVLTSTEAEGLSLAYNNFGDSHNIRFSQYQVAGSLYTIAVWYEEIPLKQ